VPWEQTSGPAALHGTAVHAAIEADVRGCARHPAIDQRAARTADAFREWWPNFAGETKWFAEPGFVFDLATSTTRFLGEGTKREAYANVGEHEVGMTADLVTLNRDDELIVYDVKTGRSQNVDPAESNTQLMTLALAARRQFPSALAVRAGLLFVSPFGVSVDEHTFDHFDLDAYEAELLALSRGIATSEPQPGKHCNYCPASHVCPATTGALAQMAPPASLDTERRRLPIVTSAGAIESMAHARHQYLTLRAAKAAVDRAWAAMLMWADNHGGIDLGDGRSYMKTEKTRESISLDDRVALDALRAELGAHWELAVTLDTSKSAIKEAAREVARTSGEKIATIERRVLTALRGVGAVKTSTSTTYDEVATPSTEPRLAPTEPAPAEGERA
jgi:CRISPR/Cas system-associated exonuclease Cas4 (RecB family)